MEVAVLNAVYTATSADFDRVTDHVQRRLKQTQDMAGGMGKTSGQSQVAREAANVQSSILRTIEQGRQAFVKSQVDASEKEVQGIVKNVQREGAARDRVARDINAAFKSREDERVRISSQSLKQSEALWTAHERGKLKTQRDAEKEGEKIVAGINRTRDTAANTAKLAADRVVREQTASAISLQRQRSAALIAEERRYEREVIAAGRRVERERVRIARETDREMQRLSGRLTARGTGSFTAGLVGGVTALVGVSAVGAIRQGASAWFEYASNLEATRIAFTTLLGSAQAADAHLKELQQFALTTPFQFPDLVEASQRMQALGFKAEQVVPILKDVGNAVAAAGGGSERLDRVVLALSQMQSKGKVMTQELNQLAEAGIPAWKIMEQQLGKTRAELVKLVEGGKISSDVFLQAFRTFSQNNFGDLMEKQSKTAIGALSNIRDSLLALSEKALRPTFVMIESKLQALSTDLQTNQADWEAWGRTIANVVNFVLTQIGRIAEGFRLVAEGYRKTFGEGSFFGDLVKGETRERFLSLPNGQVMNLRTREVFNVNERGELVSTTPSARGDDTGEFAMAGVVLDAQGRPVAGAAGGGKPTSLPTGGGGGRGRGADPAETARRMAQLSLQATLQGLQAEHDALQRNLDQNFVAREKYTADAINLELKRRQATIEGLQTELSAAEKIRKPDQRLIKVAEINSRIKEEERRSAKEIQQITDEAAAEQIRIGQATAQSQLRIIETQTEQVKARIRDYADFRMITEQRAAEWEQQQVLRVFTARERILRQELKDAGANAEKQNEARNKLKELDEERKAFIEESSRRIEAAIRRDAEHVIEFAAQIRDAFQRAAAVRMEAREADLEPLRNSILTRHQLWDAELQFEIQRENQRHRVVVAGLQDEAALDRIRIKDKKELAATLSAIQAQIQAEEELHQARLRQINTQAAEQRRQEMLQVADDLASIASDIFDAIGKSSDEFWKALKQSATNFAKQIRDELLKGFLEKLITGQAEGAEGLIGAIINPLLGARGPNAVVADNTKATQANTDAVNALTNSMGGTPAVGGGASSILNLLPSIFRGGRASGGSVEAGKVYQIHNKEFFRPNIGGKIYNLDQMNQAVGQANGEVRTIVALGDDAVAEAMESHRLTPQGRRAAIVRGRWNRKIGGLQFA